MPIEADHSLPKESAAWLSCAREMVAHPRSDCRDYLEVAREGVVLRRRWDQIDPSSAERRDILQLLPAVQSMAQRRLMRAVADRDDRVDAARAWLERDLGEDDQYLVSLLNEQARSPEATAFAVECYRDDLHWLGTQVAVLEGSVGIDFLGRILAEQETLEQEITAWEVESRKSPDRNDEQTEALHRAGHRLRIIALARQIDSLLDQTTPTHWRAWYQTWQASGRLTARLGSETSGEHSSTAAAPGETIPDTAFEELENLRDQAAVRLVECLPRDASERDEALSYVAEDLSDRVNESLTFLEDVPLPEAVRSLEIHDEDITTCRHILSEAGSAALKAFDQGLKRRRKRVAAELQERRLTWRMESIFGRWFVTGLDRLILALLLLFCVMLIAEGPLLKYEAAHWTTSVPAAGLIDGELASVPSTVVETVFAWLDLGICLVFLFDFTLRISLARRRLLYLRRNWLTGLLPSIPVGFFAYLAHNLALAEVGGSLVALRLLRYARWYRMFRPTVRGLRLVGFLFRASDRLVRQLAPILNRNLVLFERAAVETEEPPYRSALAALRERFYYRAVEVISWTTPAVRWEMAQTRIEDLTAMLSAPAVDGPVAEGTGSASVAREIPLESIIARLLAATPASISDRIGQRVAQSVARWCKALDVFGVRRLPGVRDLVSASRLPSPYDTTAVVANKIGHWLDHLLDRLHWLGDLQGTVTAPQLVDSMGEYMVKGSARPARRLVLIGFGFLAVSSLAKFLGEGSAVAELATTLDRLFGWPLMILGGICLLVLATGSWFRKIAGQATEFYAQVADAQFIGATGGLKRRLAEEQHQVLVDRVIEPELDVAARDGVIDEADEEEIEVTRTILDRLWNDYLEGSPFNRNDTKTTTQLLGNLVLISLRESRLGYNKREKKRVQRLDLSNTRLSIRGPYLWFRFISRSLAQQTAKLVADYNSHALPRSRAATAEDWKIVRYVDWLARRTGCDRDDLDLSPEFRERLTHLDTSRWSGFAAASMNHNRWFQSNDFTAVHFLATDAEVETDVRRRYGDAVADLMHRDRRDNIRRVFCTYPWHRMPKERRTFNPLTLYERHLAGGLILLLPLKMIYWAAMGLVRLGTLVARFVAEVLHPSETGFDQAEHFDSFEVARRKIHRMRKPLFMECLRMRADFDPEYLGILPPLSNQGVGEAQVVPIDDDLTKIHAKPSVRRHYREMATERRCQMLDFRHWMEQFDLGRFDDRGIRAMAIAYTIDYQGVRTQLEAARQLRSAFDAALARTADRVRLRHRFAPWFQWRYQGLFRHIFALPYFQAYDTTQQTICRRAVRARRAELLPSARLLAAGHAGHDPLAKAASVLAQIGRDPQTWTRQLVVLRAVQTLSVLDLNTYRTLVAELGEYEEKGMPEATHDAVHGRS